MSSSWDDGPFGMKFVKVPDVGAVMLERVEDVPEPGYCVHGRTRCVKCDAWCWLGDKTFDVVSNGEAAPLCLPCAKQIPAMQQFPSYNATDTLKGQGHR